MSARKALYYAYCVGGSAKEAIKESIQFGGKSTKQYVNTSIVLRPILSQFQWYHDPAWEEAKSLSKSLRNGQTHVKHSNKAGVRHYSTSSRRSIQKPTKELTEEEREKLANERSSQVPASRISRLFHYGSLAAGIGMNAAAEGLSQVSKGQSPNWKSLILSESNIDRITKKFSQMRGAALKIGQMMSFQDEKILPRELYEILSRVQNSANYMPRRQLEKVMTKELGDNWEAKFKSFDKIPIAAASIGQVHNGELLDGTKIVVKVQYPGVKDSIDSDLNNLLLLLTASRLLPKGLFLDKTVANARTELKWECDYIREAKALQRFELLLKDDPVFVVPHVYEEFTTENVLTMSRMEGTEIMNLKNESNSQKIRNFISENIMRLCLEEIAVFEFMQTDPNWANFLYNAKTNKIELLDFGASRPFPSDFIKKYRKLLTYATQENRAGAYEMSKELGYLTGLESQSMKDAHVDSVMTLGEPFRGSVEDVFDFANQTVSDRIRGNIGLMVNERLCPPPEETYSLHRKFSGIFLLCARMEASVHCAKLFSKYFALKE
ncbi:ABC1 family [Nakaseomyces glabratus]|nr:ABC1 family [Nakaseomyces glabratus]